MKFTKSFICVLILSFMMLFLLNCDPALVDKVKLKEAIDAQNEKFMEAVSNGDASALAELYTEDGQILPPNGDIVSGTETLKQSFQGMFDSGIKNVTLKTSEVDGVGEMAFEVGNYTMSIEGNQMIDEGKYIVIWKNVDGVWKLHRDIWNSNMAAPESQ